LLDESQYILIKTNQKYVIEYCNHSFQQLIGKSEPELVGQNLESVWVPTTPQAVRDFGAKRFDEQGFYTGFSAYRVGSRNYWVFFDFGKRFSIDGRWLGYECLGYLPSKKGVDFFSTIYSKMESIEAEAEGNVGKKASLEYFLQSIDAMGCGYEELVCTLQDL